MAVNRAHRIFGLKPLFLHVMTFIVFVNIVAAILFTLLGVDTSDASGKFAAGDFGIFHIVARLALLGRVSEAYDFAALQQAQLDLNATAYFMTWSYPPPFNAVLAPLGLLGWKLAYAVFSILTVAAFLWAVSRLSGRYLGLVLMASLPAILVTIRTGQNGCLTAALAAGACVFALNTKDQRAGLALGALIIKPHIGLGLGLWTLATGRMKLLLWAVLGTALLCFLSVLVFGTEVWIAFFEATRDTGGRLDEGRYPAFRMASIYAGMLSFGASPSISFAVQALAAILGLFGTVYAARKLPTRSSLAIALLMTPLFTPYFFDYDLALYAPAFALLLPALDEKGRRSFLLPMIALAWVASGSGLYFDANGADQGQITGGTFAGFAAAALAFLALAVTRKRTP